MLCNQDVGRGTAALAQAAGGDLGAAACSIVDHPRPRVAIVTGWFIPTSSPPAPETDGINGAVHLAAGLVSAGMQAILVTDAPCASALRAATTAVTEEIPITVVEPSTGAVDGLSDAWIAGGAPPSHLVAIERVGPAADGRLLGQYGFDFTPHCAPFHRLFEGAIGARPWITIGIGDGGNEIGMGKLPRGLIAQQVPMGDRIACVVPCDYLVVAGVSNWGAFGLLAALALLRPDLRDAFTRHFDPATDWRMLVAAVDQGPAVDGSPERQQYTVDGMPWRRHGDLIDQLRGLLS